ncbi:hypothetical protein LTR50_007340 [Elasticomyces elasticus]|nr:hypothetical protein LTR50_007340 [Elasticomyces elasticus]
MAYVRADEELAELQRLSQEYQPDVTGPLVGERQPSTAIASEYALADPVYRAKTAALPQRYSHYRTCRGDGRCGWRAVAFGYFEALVHIGDAGKFLDEETRLRSLNNILNAAGQDPYVYEDFTDETFDLMRKISASLQTGNADATLLACFNDPVIEQSVIQHMRMLTAAWMRTHADVYEPFVLPQSVDEFCASSIDPYPAEIEHIGISALTDVLLKPAGISLEISYLDRSIGDEVNVHRMDADAPDGFASGTIRLLYRPGHYDILYKPEDIQPPMLPPQSAPIPTYFQFAPQPMDHVYDIGASDFITMIPGMSFANTHAGWMSSSPFGSSGFAPTTLPCQPQPPAPAPTPLYAPPPALPPPPPPPAQISHASDFATPSLPPTAMPNHMPHMGNDPFRSSIWELERGFPAATTQCLPFQTSIFRNSHFNTAHFLNPDFQPEEWTPDQDYIVPHNNHRSGRHKSISSGSA